MTIGALVGVVLGLALGLLGPRLGRSLLAAFSAAVVTSVVVARAGAGGWSFLTAALVWVLLLALVVWLVARRPRVGLALTLPAALAVGAVPLLVGSGSRPSAGAIAVVAVCLVLALWGLFRPSLGIRLASAAFGARLLLWALPGGTAAWQWPVLALLLFAVGCLTAPRAELPRGLKRRATRAATAAVIAAGTAAMLVVLLTPALCPCQERGTSRMTRLRQVAPLGGYLWPELSEAVAWEDADGYRSWDNLSVQYLAASPERGVRRLPGTSVLLGRFSLNREVDRMRGIKDASEVADLQAAASAIVRAVRETAPGRLAGISERDIARTIQANGLAAGCTEDSFPPLVAAGPRAATVHASPTEAPLVAGELVVVDVGCSVNHYASDFTRTFPVGGRFSPEQRPLYEAVYAAQQAALAACRPGAVLSGKAAAGGAPSLDEIAHRVLRERLGQVGYSHGLGHGVGLFVHDVGTRGPLEPGMVLTLEPGLYLLGKLGIRIEDTYRVTETGCEPLTVGLPADPDAVEAFLAGPAAR